jgi:hypothetical protein
MSSILPLAILCCGLTPAIALGADAAGVKQGVLLGSSRAIRREFDVLNVRRVSRAFADVRVGTARATVSQEVRQMMLGREDPAITGSENAEFGSEEDAELTTPEIETRAPPGIQESGPQAQIPFGLSGIAWGFEHPTQAWRLLMPVLGSDSK